MRLAGLDGQPKTAADMAAQSRVFAEALTKFEPETVRRACKSWETGKTKWPKLAELIETCREFESPERAGDGERYKWPHGESFADRCQRLGIGDAEMVDAGMSRYGTIFEGHCSAAGITDEQFSDGWEQIRRGESVDLRAREKARRLPQQMAENDRLAADIEANPERYFASDLMLSIYRQMVARRPEAH